jgi:hypothetical protein
MCTTPRGSIPSRFAVEREVVNGAQREAVDNRGDALGLDVGNDVGGLDKGALTQRADRAPVPVGAHHVELEALLVKPDPSVARRIRTDVRARDQASGPHVLDREPGLEHHGARRRVIAGDEHRRDHEVLARREGTKVDEWCLELVRGSQRAVIRLLDRAGAVGIGEQRAGLVERVGVGVVERRREGQGGRSALSAATMNAALERAETAPLSFEREPLAEPRERHKVVIGVG